MYISSDIRELLCKKLNFNNRQLSVIDDSLPISAKILGYVKILQSDHIERKEKIFAVNNLQKLRADIGERVGPTSRVLENAYNEFYSFRRFVN